MSKELEILTFADVCVKGWLQQDKERLEEWRKDREVLYSAITQAEKEHKALDIIIKKEVNVSDFVYACKCSRKELKEVHRCSSNYELACICVGCEKEQLTQEEYDLLKEVSEKWLITN